MKEELIDIKEAANYLSITEAAIRKLVEEGRIKTIRKGEKWKFNKNLIHDALNYQLKSLKKEELASLEVNQENKPIFIHEIIKSQDTLLNLINNTKSKVLEELVDLFTRRKNKSNRDILLKALRDRERLCTTAITAGVAIPHPRRAIKNLVKKPFIAFARSKPGVDFESIDGNLTYLFFLVCAPKDDIHLKIMARLSRLLRNYEFRKSLQEAETQEKIVEIIKEYELKDKINL